MIGKKVNSSLHLKKTLFNSVKLISLLECNFFGVKIKHKGWFSMVLYSNSTLSNCTNWHPNFYWKMWNSIKQLLIEYFVVFAFRKRSKVLNTNNSKIEIFLKNYHKRKNKGDILYRGSTIRWFFGGRRGHGVYLCWLCELQT